MPGQQGNFAVQNFHNILRPINNTFFSIDFVSFRNDCAKAYVNIQRNIQT